MNSKERVLRAINFEKTDRLPRDFHACDVVLDRLYENLKINSYKDLLLHLKSDIVDIRGVVDPIWIADFPKFSKNNGITTTYLGFEMKEQDTVFGKVREHCGYALAQAEDISDLEKFRWPSVDWFDFSNMQHDLKEYKDFAIMASGASVFQHPTLVRSIDNFLCDMISDPEIADYIIDKYLQFYLKYYDKMFTSTNKYIDILRIADDMGMQDRCLISKDTFKRYLMKPIRQLCEMAHSHDVKVMFHSCGAVFEFIDLFIECGVDILDPLQPLASGMDATHIANNYLGKICLHGSVDTQFTLPKGTQEQVRAEINNRDDILGKNNTGFIIAPSHTLQPDVSVDNIIAMYDAIDKLE